LYPFAAERYPDTQYEEEIVNYTCMQLVSKPSKLFDLICI
jgi:isocitrate/isopropylmalate dehydrogenase